MQLKMFAAHQSKCFECRTSFVGLSKDVIRLWPVGDIIASDWLADVNWAVDRTYQENIKFCSTDCLVKYRTREALAEIDRLRHKNYGKRK